MGGVGAGQAHAAAQPRHRRRLCAGLDVQDGGGDGGAGVAQRLAGRCRVLLRLPRHRRRALPLLAQGRPRSAEHARWPEEQLRRVLLRDRQARRDRPDRGDGAPARSRHRAGDRPARRAQRLHPDARVAHRPRPSLEHRRHRRLRHRPGLHPGDAAATRDLRGARRHRPQGRAAPDAQAGRCDAARIAAHGLAQSRRRRPFAAHRARRHVGGGERGGRHRAGGQASGPALADGRQDRFVAGAARIARATRRRHVRQLQAAVAVPPARPVRRLRAVRRAALRGLGGGRARQRRRRGRRADRARHHDGHAAARSGGTRRAAGAQIAQREGTP